ncbi:hypothetical protein IGJ19_000137 [Enterococcus sp. DIV1368b]|uniref:hypothetical protein n=1 Tax=Enterococcus mundtii TaxID=53346 RepID=UPI0008F40D4B|nr:hypothetical protein [Enterococcus mundtii]SFM03715.1 hypothetical protein SAMN04487758_10880 [Enterococcus mundtii]
MITITIYIFLVVFVGLLKIITQLNEIIGLLRSKSKADIELNESEKATKETE